MDLHPDIFDVFLPFFKRLPSFLVDEIICNYLYEDEFYRQLTELKNFRLYNHYCLLFDPFPPNLPVELVSEIQSFL
jgi:hypothetical protein